MVREEENSGEEGEEERGRERSGRNQGHEGEQKGFEKRKGKRRGSGLGQSDINANMLISSSSRVGCREAGLALLRGPLTLRGLRWY